MTFPLLSCFLCVRKPFKRPKHFPTENESAFTHGRRRDPSSGVFSTVSARSGLFDERLPRIPVCLRPGAYGPINVSGYETDGASFPGMRTDLAVPSTSVESSALLHASIACAFSQRFCARIYPPRPRTAGSPGPVAAGAAGPHAPADGPQPGGTERPRTPRRFGPGGNASSLLCPALQSPVPLQPTAK